MMMMMIVRQIFRLLLIDDWNSIHWQQLTMFHEVHRVDLERHHQGQPW